LERVACDYATQDPLILPFPSLFSHYSFFVIERVVVWAVEASDGIEDNTAESDS
jgi:hypothetical protein